MHEKITPIPPNAGEGIHHLESFVRVLNFISLGSL